jgi:hypothetical protein
MLNRVYNWLEIFHVVKYPAASARAVGGGVGTGPGVKLDLDFPRGFRFEYKTGNFSQSDAFITQIKTFLGISFI